MCVTGFYRVFGRKGRGFSVRSIQRRSFDPPGLYENDVDVDDDDDDDPNFLFFGSPSSPFRFSFSSFPFAVSLRGTRRNADGFPLN